MGPISRRVGALLLSGYFNWKTQSVCKELWKHRDHLWTLVDVPGVEPTNNAAERALRHAVIWRKPSFGTQSAGGSRFVEWMLTVIKTCCRQARSAFAWLTQAVRARLAEVAVGQLRDGNRVRTFDGQTGDTRFDFAPFPGFGGGVNVAAFDRDGDGLTDIASAAGPGGGPHVRTLSGLDLRELESFFPFDPAFNGGVFVG